MRIVLSVKILLLLFIATGICAAESVNIIIPEGINLTRKEIMKDIYSSVISKAKWNGAVEIVFYYYSRGAETLSYSDKGKILQKTKTGKIKVLVKLKKDNLLKKAIFTSAEGKNKEQIIKKIALKIVEAVNEI